MTKTVKYCGHCQVSCHWEQECYKKHSHLLSAQKQKQKKRKSRDNKEDKSSGDNDVEKSAYLAFMAMSSSSKVIVKDLANIWIWDCGNSQHICHDTSVFTQMTKKDLAPIQGIGVPWPLVA